MQKKPRWAQKRLRWSRASAGKAARDEKDVMGAMGAGRVRKARARSRVSAAANSCAVVVAMSALKGAAMAMATVKAIWLRKAMLGRQANKEMRRHPRAGSAQPMGAAMSGQARDQDRVKGVDASTAAAIALHAMIAMPQMEMPSVSRSALMAMATAMMTKTISTKPVSAMRAATCRRKSAAEAAMPAVATMAVAQAAAMVKMVRRPALIPPKHHLATSPKMASASKAVMVEAALEVAVVEVASAEVVAVAAVLAAATGVDAAAAVAGGVEAVKAYSCPRIQRCSRGLTVKKRL